jgi:hypothetical protein
VINALQKWLNRQLDGSERNQNMALGHAKRLSRTLRDPNARAAVDAGYLTQLTCCCLGWLAGNTGSTRTWRCGAGPCVAAGGPRASGQSDFDLRHNYACWRFGCGNGRAGGSGVQGVFRARGSRRGAQPVEHNPVAVAELHRRVQHLATCGSSCRVEVRDVNADDPSSSGASATTLATTRS